MVSEPPEVTVNKHHPTGSAEVSISIWLGENERKGLMDRLFSQQTLLHDRDRVIEALRLVDDENKQDPSTIETTELTDKSNWKVRLVE